MKKILIVILAAISVSATQAQNAIDKYFATYKADPAYTKIEMTQKMMELAGYFDAQTEHEKQLVEAVKKIEGISIIYKEKETNARSLYNDAVKKVGSSFEELMSVSGENNEVRVLVKEFNGVIKELLIVVSEDDSFGIVDVFGEVDLKTIRTVTEIMSMKGMDKVNEEDLTAAANISMFPNPVSRGENATLKFSEEAQGGIASIFDSAGKQVWKSTLSGTQSVVPANNLTSGAYTVVVNKGDARIFSQVMIVK